MKFAMVPTTWDSVVAELEEAGHSHVTELADADFLVYNGSVDEFPAPLPPSIRFVQYAFTGVEQFIEVGLLDGNIPWANSRAVYGKPVAEYALTLLLAAYHQLKMTTLAGSFDRRWDADAAQQFLVSGKTVALVGAGGIARDLIPLLQPFGADIIAVNRSGRPVDGAARVTTDADEVWAEADVVVLALPLTPETEGIISRDVLKKMKAISVLINVGRGKLVDTDALAWALETGEIAAAGLEVTDPEPLPAGHRLWEIDNCIISPHIGAPDSVAIPLIAPTIIANAEAFEDGREMPTYVDPTIGY